ncbi:MAG: Bug family tripartite tricarboxylate transporter substrate binding protein [Ottowia sp.]|uniref:Bug family tripartite tricarboxylate transporter substrate binding protein n=1 Tax=Ottowia sp. TaxID=1898956 RepID=UPI003C712548
MKRRALLTSLALASSILASASASAQNDKPLRLLVGFPAGVSIDVVTRIISEKMKDELKRPVIVDNRPGAGGRLAADLLKAAPPDGNTVMVTPIVVPVLAPMVFSKLGYNPQADFAPVGKICDFSFALAVPANSPVKNLKDYAAWLKVHPQEANFGSPAAGSLPHFFGVMIGSALNVDMVHVPFNGGSALQSAVLGGHVPAGIDVVMEWQQNAKAGKVRVLATSGAERSKIMPDIPTFKEQGFPEAVGQGWFAMYAPAKTSQATIDEINKALNNALAAPEVRERFASLGLEAAGGTPAGLQKTMHDDALRWGPTVKKSGFRAD